MIASNILENRLSTFTGLKFEMLFLLSVPLSIGKTAPILAASGKIPMVKLSLMIFVTDSVKIFADGFTSFSGILSTPMAFFISIFFKRIVSIKFSNFKAALFNDQVIQSKKLDWKKLL